LGGGKADFVPFLLGYSNKYRQTALHFDEGVWVNLSKHRAAGGIGRTAL